MAVIKWDDLHKELKNKVYRPLYLLMGEEPFYIDVISRFIEEKVLDDTEKEFNQSIFYGRDTDVETVVSTARRYPMMANHQVVIVKEAQHLKEIERLEKYAENPLVSTILVICYKYKTLDQRKSLCKRISEKGIIMESKKVYDNKMPQWISEYVKSKGYKIDARSTQLLADHLGNDLGKVVNEIKKVFISLPKGSEITSLIIEKNIGISKDFNVFELQNALGEKNSFKAFQIAKYFADNPKSNPLISTLALLHSFFMRLFIYHSLRDKSAGNAAAELGMSPYLVHNIQKAAARYPVSSLFKIFSYLREYDLKSKGVDNPVIEEGELLKELLYKILYNV